MQEHFINKYRSIAALLLCLLLAACATPQQTIEISKSPPDIPLTRELESTPFYPQRDYQCGPAALATVINYHQPETTIEQLIPLVYIPALKGSLQLEMLAATSQFNRLAVKQDQKLTSILREVAAGNPVLVMQNLGFESYPFWHYAVVIGYDLEQQTIILRSGEIKRLVRPLSVFERTWQRSNYWSVVVVPPKIMPPTAKEDPYTRAIVAFEAKASRQAILTAYQTATKRWPRNYILQMGLGNAGYAVQDYAMAQQAFLSATEIQPERAQAWNNLAYALLQQGEKTQALSAIEKALVIEPDNREYINSYTEISQSH